MQRDTSDRASTPDATRDRVKYVLTYLWRGNQREMARAIGVSQGLISKVVHGQQGPGRRLMSALAEYPGINAEWIRTGTGQPLPLPDEGSLPIASVLLPGPPLRHPHLLSGIRHPVARAYERPTRYWLWVPAASPLLAEPGLSLLVGDLLLMEADADWTGRPTQIAGRLCGIRFPDHPEPAYRFGVVAASPDGLRARLLGGSYVLPSPSPTSKPKSPLKTGDKEPSRRRRTIRFPEHEEEKSRKRAQMIADARTATANGVAVSQEDIVAVHIYMVRPELPLAPFLPTSGR